MAMIAMSTVKGTYQNKSLRNYIGDNEKWQTKEKGSGTVLLNGPDNSYPVV